MLAQNFNRRTNVAMEHNGLGIGDVWASKYRS